MPRIPTLGSRLTRPENDDPARRLGRAGLDALMRDPRYMDGGHPEHPGVLDAVRRGFELVFDPPAPGRRLEEATGATRRPAARPPFATPPIVPDTEARPDGLPFDLDLPRNPPVTHPDGPFGRHFARLVDDPRQVEILPTALREALGRRVLLAALAEDGRPLPKGFESEDMLPSNRRAVGDAAGRRPGERDRPRLAQAAPDDGEDFRRRMPGDPEPLPPARPMAVPDYRGQVFSGARRDEWNAMNDAVHDAGEGSPNRTRAMGEIFAAEGGLARDPDSSAFGGITQGTLEDIKKREPGLKDVTRPEQLDTPEKMAAAYRGYLKFTMDRYGGPEMLDTLDQPETAAAVADTLFRHGYGDGHAILKQGAANVMDKMAPEDRRTLGLKPMNTPKDMFDNLRQLDGEALRDELVKIRKDWKDVRRNEHPRIEHFRFPRDPRSSQ